jgi:hypothetical protein
VDIEGELLRPDIEAPKGDVQYRLGYYIVKAKGAWHWGQYCPFIPADDFEPLVEQARAEGTIPP